MYIPAINTNNQNRPNFGMLFEPQNVKWNEIQKPIVDTIKYAMRLSKDEFNGQTAERYYKNTKGMDFMLSPGTDTVHLTGYQGLKTIGTGKDKGIKWREQIYIGEYEQPSDFDVSDIKTGIKNKNQTDLSFAAICAGVIIAALAMVKGMGPKALEQAKNLGRSQQLIENADSTAMKSSDILKDTTKTVQEWMQRTGK